MKASLSILLTAAAVAASLAGAAPAQAEDACAGEPGGGGVKLNVDTSGLRDADGLVAVTVYPDDPDRFLAPGGKLLRVRTKAIRPTTRACFWLPPGHYAVAIYHDENGNRSFDRDPMGRPAEGYGFSNDAPARMGLPEYDAVRFRVSSSGSTIRIRMTYLK
jgi:uncharacterized protein (DUF2141 family)